MDERYAIYDLSPNSALAFPAHDEQVSLSAQSSSYNIRGYAYGGGGRRITRVEVTLDKGHSWILADISYPEDAYRTASSADESLFGGRLDTHWRETAFCWCFWSLDLPLTQIADAQDIMVRSMDEAMCVQPRDMYWSVLGMMNNPWFRVVVHREGDMLRFEHPTQPALIPGGWMERVKKEGGDLANGFWGERIAGGSEGVEKKQPEDQQEMNMKKEDIDKIITIDDLRKHETEEAGSWFVLNGEVYDGTSFFNEHPGGAQSIISAAGTDVSDEFMAIRESCLELLFKTP